MPSAPSGERVALLDHAADWLHRVTDELKADGHHVVPLVVDVRDAQAVDQAAQRFAEVHDGIDLALNDAAAYPNTAVIDMEDSE